MAVTPTEAASLAARHRAVAEAYENLAKIEKWASRVDGQTDFSSSLSWNLGRGVDGYSEIRNAVEPMVDALLPGLIKKVVEQARTDLHIAICALPKHHQTEQGKIPQ